MSDSPVILIAAQGVGASAAYLYAALGEAVGQRAGIYNLGVDGVMLMGAILLTIGLLRRMKLFQAVKLGESV